MLPKKRIMQNCHPLSRRYYKFYLFVILFYLSGIIWLVYNLFVGQSFVLCPTKRFFNIPCPGCGMTRAVKSLVSGNIVDAIYYNANVVLVFPLFLILFFFVLYDCMFSRIYTIRIYEKTCSYINNRCFLVIFIIVELFIEYHHIINNI